MKTLLGIPKEKIDKTKYIKQLRSVIKWTKDNGSGYAKGTIIAATGFGKSIIGCLAIKKMLKKDSSKKTLIVVPTKPLKTQWEEACSSFNLTNVEVLVVNTIALKDNLYHFDLLIVDEVHLMAAEKFSTIFHKVKYKWAMGLTATIERLDGKEEMLKRYLPIVDRITQQDAINNKWINDFVEINVPTPLSIEETTLLSNLSKKIRSFTAKFGDFNVMKECMNKVNAQNFARMYYPELSNNTIALAEKTTELIRDAVQGQRCIRMRQEILYNNEQKVKATVELINKFNLKTITFAQSTNFVDLLKEQLGNKVVVYHSYLKAEKRLVEKTKLYKTESGIKKALLNNPSKKYRVVADGYELYWKESQTFGLDFLKKEALLKFSDNKYKVNVICTAKALDQGFDVPDIQFAIDASRTSNPTQHVQRTGQRLV